MFKQVSDLAGNALRFKRRSPKRAFECMQAHWLILGAPLFAPEICGYIINQLKKSTYLSPGWQASSA